MSSDLAHRRAVGPGGPAVRAAELRRWIRRRRLAAGGPRISASSLYVAALTVAMAGALFGQRLLGVVWPVHAGPVTDERLATGAARLALIGLAAYALLRRNGPLAISRAHLSWLFLAPVSRRGLLLPALLGVLAVSAVMGGMVGVAAVGQLAHHPVPGTTVLVGVVAGAAVAVLAGLVAVWGQAREQVARVGDIVAVVVFVPAVAVATGLWRPAGRLLAGVPAAGQALAVVAIAGALGLLIATLRMLAGFPSHRIHDASVTRGSLLDAAVAVEPTFVAELLTRQSWERRALRSVPIGRVAGLPLLTGPDLLVLRRRPARLVWLAAAALAPAVVASGPPWLLAAVVLVGAMIAANTTLDAVRRDSAQPALLRLLGLTGRQALAGRLVVPTVLASVWAGAALAVPALLGHLPPGPWWALGLAIGPAAAVGAVRRSRIGYVRHDLPALETPMGSIATGPVIWLLAGIDLLVLLSVPALISLLGRSALTWDAVLVQAGLAAACLGFYLSSRSDPSDSRL